MTRILVLNKAGSPYMWATLEQAIFYHAQGKVVWSAGSQEYRMYGGINRISGDRSSLATSSIIATDGHYCAKTPGASRPLLFARDKNLCAYCGLTFGHEELTMDHVIPKYHKGTNSWTNLVTACKRCNHHKGARTPEQAHMKLLYVPYTPNINEAFILKNRRILADQMDFLINAGLCKESRLRA